jgi:hypothetical protein
MVKSMKTIGSVPPLHRMTSWKNVVLPSTFKKCKCAWRNIKKKKIRVVGLHVGECVRQNN